MNIEKLLGNINLKNSIGIAVLIFGVVGGIFLYKRLKRKQKEDENSVETIFENVNENRLVESATLSKEQIALLVNKIKNAWGYLNDDEEAIFSAFRQLGNKYDLALLIKMYYYKGEDLATALQNRLSVSEIEEINDILASKGIDVRF